MKNIIALIALLLYSSIFAQSQFRINKKDQFMWGITSSYSSIKDSGTSFGAEIEYIGSVYTRASISSTPNIKSTDIIGSIGASFTSGLFERTRYYTGIRLGFTKKSRTNATAGWELGIEQKVSKNVIIGLRATYDYRSDYVFSGYNNGWVNNNFIKIGFLF